MIDLMKKIIGADNKNDPSEVKPQDRPSHDVRLATCAVFIEMAKIDDEFDDDERDLILSIFEKEHNLARTDVLELERASREALDKSLDRWQFTNVINQHYSRDEKCRIVELLWELVYADGRLDEHENYLIHKLGRLLRLTHRDLIDAKLQVLRRQREGT